MTDNIARWPVVTAFLTVLCTTAVLQSQTVAQAGQDMSRLRNYYVFKRKEEKNMNNNKATSCLTNTNRIV